MTKPSLAGDATVAAYLEADPEFFLRHPELTARLRLPHGPEGTLSLVEHQMALLRAQVEDERRLLAQLIARARDYEALAGRLHGLMLQLISAPDRLTLEALLSDSLRREFEAEAVALVFDTQAGQAGTDPAIPSGEATGTTTERQARARCGPLDPDHAALLFADTGVGIRSAAIIPFHSPTQSGLLAIGSTDPARFGPDMGTDHLHRLGELVSACLAALEP
jgi:uncharacterized protein YigA (DUF484 family)